MDCTTCKYYKFNLIDTEYIKNKEVHYCKLFGIVIDLDRVHMCDDYEYNNNKFIEEKEEEGCD